MTIDIERLKHDLDYWNKHAPEGATHYVEDECVFPWRKREEAEYYKRNGAWARLPGPPEGDVVIPRPSPAWDGSGLPVEGTVCRMRLAFRTEDRITITYMGDGVFCYRAENGMEYTGSLSDAAFEPLKTEKERVCEYWRAKMPYPGSNSTMLDLEALYDAGALKMPGGE